MNRVLHVANGTSTTRVIEAARLDGRTSIWADVLYEGPVPAVDDLELLPVRARVLAAPSETDYQQVVAELQRWRATIADTGSYDELALWYEHDLFDQLNLIQLLTWLDTAVMAAKPVSLVSIGTFPGRPSFKGLGELSPAELAPLFDRREPVTRAQYVVADRAWKAFRHTTPHLIGDLLHTDTSALPFLASALRRLLEEYPWVDDGLSASERRLLEIAATPTELADAFVQMHDHERSYYITDGSFLQLLHEFSTGETAPIALSAGSVSVGRIPAGTMKLTDAGRAMLEGRLDRVTARGIDRWIGGTHVTPQSVWRWDPAAARIVR